jgi:hypothetical protein
MVLAIPSEMAIPEKKLIFTRNPLDIPADSHIIQIIWYFSYILRSYFGKVHLYEAGFITTAS